MTVDELIEAIKKSYDERIRGSKYSGSASLRVIETIAAKTGLTMSMVLLKHLDKQYPDGEIPEADLRTIVADSLEHNYSYIAEKTRRAQEKILEEAEVGIKPVVPEFNRGRAEGIAKNYSETGNREEFKKNIQNHSQNIVDESIKQNARVHQRLGLEPRVTRIYDGVGVHKRKDPCAWCKARAGTNMPYNEAYDKGAFERHPGCGCEILYMVGKRTQRQSDWTHNEWEDVSTNVSEKTEGLRLATNIRLRDNSTGEMPRSYSERGIKLSQNLQVILELLKNPGDYLEGSVDAFPEKDVRALAVEAKVEFARIAFSDKSYLIRGYLGGTEISEEIIAEMKQYDGVLDFHCHPYNGDLIPSKEDQKAMQTLEKQTGQRTSRIITADGRVATYNKNGIITANDTVDNSISEEDRIAFLRLFGGD